MSNALSKFVKDFVAKAIDKVSIKTERADPAGSRVFLFLLQRNCTNEKIPKREMEKKDG